MHWRNIVNHMIVLSFNKRSNRPNQPGYESQLTCSMSVFEHFHQIDRVVKDHDEGSYFNIADVVCIRIADLDEVAERIRII